jgi:glyoxylase-like metal-dependent hydrolase (beta-lactamase superfamily II)
MLRVSDIWSVDVLLEGTSYSSTCTLLTSPSHRVIVDTGLSIQHGELLSAIHTRGLEPADIDLVINTHLHLDHCGNNALFSRAAIVMSKAEWAWTSAFYTAIIASRTPEQAAPEFYPELASYDLTPRTIRNVARMARFFWSQERLGNEAHFHWLESSNVPAGLEILPSPGHTPHHISIRVAAATPVLVAGDAVLAEQADAKVKTMIPYSRAAFLATRDRLIQAGGTIIPGHGPLFERVKA